MPCRIGDALECHGGGLSKLVTPELLAEQNLHIGLVIDHQDKHVQTFTPGLLTDTPRGSTIRNSVNAPGWVLTSIDPLCCLTMMS